MRQCGLSEYLICVCRLNATDSYLVWSVSECDLLCVCRLNATDSYLVWSVSIFCVSVV